MAESLENLPVDSVVKCLRESLEELLVYMEKLQEESRVELLVESTKTLLGESLEVPMEIPGRTPEISYGETT